MQRFPHDLVKGTDVKTEVSGPRFGNWFQEGDLHLVDTAVAKPAPFLDMIPPPPPLLLPSLVHQNVGKAPAFLLVVWQCVTSSTVGICFRTVIRPFPLVEHQQDWTVTNLNQTIAEK